MSNKIVPEVYDAVMRSVINALRSDFEEYGVEDDVLDVLAATWRENLFATRVAKFVEDDEDEGERDENEDGEGEGEAGMEGQEEEIGEDERDMAAGHGQVVHQVKQELQDQDYGGSVKMGLKGGSSAPGIVKMRLKGGGGRVINLTGPMRLRGGAVSSVVVWRPATLAWDIRKRTHPP